MRRHSQFFVATALTLMVASGAAPVSYGATQDLSGSSVIATSAVSTSITSSKIEIYLDTFIPSHTYFMKVKFAPAAQVNVRINGTTTPIQSGQSLTLSFTTSGSIPKSQLHVPLRTVEDDSGNTIIAVYPSPPDFPDLTLDGDASLISKRQMLSTIDVAAGSYAVASVGEDIRFFTKSAVPLIGFRSLRDTPSISLPGGRPAYGFLEQSDLSVSATSPGTWRLLDSGFNVIGRINDVQTRFGRYHPEGHGMTTARNGNPVVIATVTRKVDSSWLQRPYPLPVLDCLVGEVSGGRLVRPFSFWDWAVAHKAQSKPLLDSMPLQQDPQNPKSPIDICHANSLQYFGPLNAYVISLRSPSVVVILKADFSKVLQVLSAEGQFQHFARFRSAKEVTALGNNTFGSQSTFLRWRKQGATWKLTSIPFPVHMLFCGNASLLDETHVWIGGGCPSPFLPGTLGALYQVNGDAMTLVASIKARGITNSYRADLSLG